MAALRGIAYSRVSTYGQLMGDNLKDHEVILRGLAVRYGIDLEPTTLDLSDRRTKPQQDLSAYGVILEQDSGDYDLLEGLQAIVGGFKRGDTPWSVLLVKEYTRLGRSFFETMDILRTCDEAGIRVIAADGLDTANPMWKPIAAMLAYYAEQERIRTRERTMGGRLSKLMSGKHIRAKIPFGFQRIGQGRDAEIAVEPSEAKLIMRAKTLMVDRNEPPLNAMRQLILEGYTARGGKPLTQRFLHLVLTNEALKGRWVYNRYRASGKKGKRGSIVERPITEHIVLEGPRILSDEDFEALQLAVKSARRGIKVAYEKRPLAGRVICHTCQIPMHVAQKTKIAKRKSGAVREYKHWYYQCHKCGAISNSERLEAGVLERAWYLITHPEHVGQLLAEHTQKASKIAQDAQVELVEIQERLEAKKQELSRYKHLYGSGRIDDSEWDELAKPVNATIRELEGQAQQLARRVALASIKPDARVVEEIRSIDLPANPQPEYLLPIAQELNIAVVVDRMRIEAIRYRALEPVPFALGMGTNSDFLAVTIGHTIESCRTTNTQRK